jgi:hypothetical protein
MSEWKNDDTVVTTYRTIAQASAEAFEMGAKKERERIIEMLETVSFVDDLPLGQMCSATGALLRVHAHLRKTGENNE